MTVKELAVYLNVHPSTIYRMLAQNKLPCFKIGSDWRFHRATIDDWIRSQTTR
jgi:excisionase family DNA binding protein